MNSHPKKSIYLEIVVRNQKDGYNLARIFNLDIKIISKTVEFGTLVVNIQLYQFGVELDYISAISIFLWTNLFSLFLQFIHFFYFYFMWMGIELKIMDFGYF